MIDAKLDRPGVGTSAAGIIGLAVTLCLGACGDPAPSVWHKTGADAEDTRSAQRDCSDEASGFSFLTQSPANSSGVGSVAAQSQTADVYRACMAKRGFVQGPSAPSQPEATGTVTIDKQAPAKPQ